MKKTYWTDRDFSHY